MEQRHYNRHQPLFMVQHKNNSPLKLTLCMTTPTTKLFVAMGRTLVLENFTDCLVELTEIDCGMSLNITPTECSNSWVSSPLLLLSPISSLHPILVLWLSICFVPMVKLNHLWLNVS